MLGKELKVVEYNLTFGGKDRFVDVFGVFRYKKNNNLYVLYTDVHTNYPIIYYGSSHIKNNSILCMNCKEEDVEIIKEYVFKVTEGEALDSFEIIPLENIEGIEIISSKKLEVKMEIIHALVDKVLPKKEKKEEVSVKVVKKKSAVSFMLKLMIILAILVGGTYVYFITLQRDDVVIKTITCNKVTSEQKVNASVKETMVLNFNNKDILDNIETTKVFQFTNDLDYENFINKGTMYKYMPDDHTRGGFDQDADLRTFTIIINEKVESNYQKPTDYEEVLNYYKREGYDCDEKILGE